MEQIAFFTLLIIAGGYFLIRNVLMLTNEEKLKKYLTESPKGKIWINKIGMEKTIQRSKKTFLPLGILFAFIILGYGTLTLFQIF